MSRRTLRLLLAAAVCAAAVPSAARAQSIQRVTGVGSNPGRLDPTEAKVTVTVAGGAGGDAGSDGGGEQSEPEWVDPIAWGCSAQLGGDGRCGLAAALGLALVLAALIRARGGEPFRSRMRRRSADAQQRDGGWAAGPSRAATVLTRRGRRK